MKLYTFEKVVIELNQKYSFHKRLRF